MAQWVEQAVNQSECRWFDLRLLLSTCRSVLGQDTESQTAPDDCATESVDKIADHMTQEYFPRKILYLNKCKHISHSHNSYTWLFYYVALFWDLFLTVMRQRKNEVSWPVAG